MAAENDFLLIYAESDNGKRIDIIFEHYDNFLELADMFEGRLFDDIKEEKAFNRREARGDLGIRVQTSGKSDPTCKHISQLKKIIIVLKYDIDSLAVVRFRINK